MKRTQLALCLTAVIVAVFVAADARGQKRNCNPGNPCFHCQDTCDCSSEGLFCTPAHRCFHIHVSNMSTTREVECNCNHLTPCDSSHPCWHPTVVNETLTTYDCDCDSIECSIRHPCWHRECGCNCTHTA
ncbi:cement protein 20-like [Amphibalanus amphitrite]